MNTTTSKRVELHDEELVHIDTDQQGYIRKKWGRGFAYFDCDEELITDETLRQRLHSLAIPPARTDVWICPDPSGHIQATGSDDKDRKQYIYHQLWEERRNATKFNRMLAFGHALPDLRRSLEKHRRKRNLDLEKVVALVIILLDRTFIRVGNEEYRKENDSYGLTTLRQRHLEIQKTKLKFEFNGKSGKDHKISIHDRQLALIVQPLQELPGQLLFQYFDEDDKRRKITSTDVNTYHQQHTGHDFTAKDFRTWHASVMAATALKENEYDSKSATKEERIKKMINKVANALGNTPAISRKYYIHPLILKMYHEDHLVEFFKSEQPDNDYFSEGEMAKIELLEHNKTLDKE